MLGRPRLCMDGLIGANVMQAYQKTYCVYLCMRASCHAETVCNCPRGWESLRIPTVHFVGSEVFFQLHCLILIPATIMINFSCSFLSVN